MAEIPASKKSLHDVLIEEQARLDAKFPRPGSKWRHVKRDARYTVTCCARIESNMEWSVVYFGSQNQHWVRPLNEFMDGRFEKLSDD